MFWTDIFGHTYQYEPYEADPLAELEVQLSADALLGLAEASRALGSVPGLPHAGIEAVLYRSESSASSIIEGLAAGPRRILEAEFAGEDEIRDPIGSRIVRNLQGLRDALRTPWPARSEDILRWHELLTSGHPSMRPENIGAYRTQQNWIGGDSTGPRDAAFIPPTPEDVIPLIVDLEQFCARTDVAPLVQAFIAHGRFEVVHPFVDGNGRVGRMLLQHLLVARLRLTAPVPVSVPWSQEPDRYVRALRAYQDGDLSSWIVFAAESTIRAIDWMRLSASAISDLLDDLRSRVVTRGESVAARIITDLPIRPLVDAQSVAERYEVSTQAAHRALKGLEQNRILAQRAFSRRRKTKGRPRQVFTAPELIDLLERLTAI